MVQRLEKLRCLEQEDAVDRIADRFGRRFIYINNHGNAAIDKEVLSEFRGLTDGRVVWDRSEFLWRFRQVYDPKGTRMVS